MEKKNSIFIATSIDGYIADREGQIDWLHTLPNPTHDDMGYAAFMAKVDAVVMGRKTFETVQGFGKEWPYDRPVFVLSQTLDHIPSGLEDRVFLLRGRLTDVLKQIYAKGLQKLYIDGGTTIQHFLKADLIDEMIITTMPILLGGGAHLFAALPSALSFDLVKANTYLNQVVQSRYVRNR